MSIPEELKKRMRSEAFWKVNVFSSEGFSRQRCNKCGCYFWASGKRETCSEPPCGEYSFIGNPVGKKLDVEEVEKIFLKWFERNGHTIISRYPVVARWKPDTFFTGASIYCFQPFVVKGEVDPPANPLVIAQPSVRFVDLENVGLGTGRHLTSFTMGGHHAFNNKEKEIYWKEETVELCYNFFTSKIKIPKEELVFKESWWEGGGNAGPCFEVIVRGNEIATLVFMEYEMDGKLKRMKTKVVDTGYGLERIVWLAKGTQTIYDATHGKIVNYLKKLVGRDDRRALHNIYQLADHSQTIMFILGDGIVPSNVQEGYLARLLIRRCERAIRNLDLSISTHDLVRRQIERHRKRYPEFWKERNEILKLVEVEEEKYKRTLERGRSVVAKIINELKRSGKNKIDENTLVLLYDSHGLLPSDVKKFAGDFPVEEVEDLEAKIAAKKEIPKKKEERKICIDVKDLPKTEILYYKSIHNWKAKVLKIENNWIILDKSAFYPRSGGQEPDHGVIIGKEGTFKVVDVEKVDNVILHRVEGKVKLKVGEVVTCKIDKERREQLTQHHTATHLVNAACRKIIGNWVWQHSAFKDVDRARLDITHYENLTDEEIEKIEKQVKKWIKDDLKIEKRFIPRDKAERKYGFRLYQGGVPIGKELRVVSIDDIDHEACSGTHCDRTGEVETFLILESERVQDGIVRITFVAGNAAKKVIEENKRIIKELEKILGVKKENIIDEVIKLVEKRVERIKSERKKVEAEASKLLETLKSRFEEREGVKVLIGVVSGDMNLLKEISRKLTENNTIIVLFGKQKDRMFIFASRGDDVRLNIGNLVKEICEMFNGKGGGTERLGQGVVFGEVDEKKVRELIWKSKE